MSKSKKILIAPLDWGLGHATRCIPIINVLLENGAEVIIAGNDKTNSLLQQEFPLLTYIYLEGYNVVYSTNKYLMPFSILQQIPKLIKSIYTENRWLSKVIVQYNIDAVISDNRYGMHNKSITSVIITHQLQIQVPQSSLLQKLLNIINTRLINKFQHCWVPDFKENSISGVLSINQSVKNITHLGILSRFRLPLELPKMKYKILVLISGPEPQRSIFEEKAILQAKKISENTLIVRGVPPNSNFKSIVKNIHIVDHLPANMLQETILSSEIIICRAGYSTIMDLIKLNKKAILIPTPGQTEQEYLAYYLSKLNLYDMQTQENINFANFELNLTDSNRFIDRKWDNNLYKDEISTWYHSL